MVVTGEAVTYPKTFVKHAQGHGIFHNINSQICGSDTAGKLFRRIDDFLKTASSIVNRSKSRAGCWLQNHVETLLRKSEIPHRMRPNLGPDGTLDVIIPSIEAYFDQRYPTNRILIVGLKTTCKDRWRQVTQERPRVKQKYLLTLQQGITEKQLKQMAAARVSLVVPKDLHKFYPRDCDVKPLRVTASVDVAKEKTRD